MKENDFSPAYLHDTFYVTLEYHIRLWDITSIDSKVDQRRKYIYDFIIRNQVQRNWYFYPLNFRVYSINDKHDYT